ncbi:MAG: hypothetical protein EA402_09465 [Planctomycetota bacterium]|nr:MAG: hypothetical protein EA402_09465 [Planctomycetota bacterium]
MDQEPIAYRVLITAADGRQIHWHKNGQLHQLSPALGPTWIAHFNRDIWLVSPEGAFVPPGADERAQIIAEVRLEAVYPSAAG